jgi:hypothetical protein
VPVTGNPIRTVDGWIRDLQSVSGAVAKMPEQLVPVIRREAEGAIDSGVSLDGEVWDEKVGGGKALEGGKKSLSVYASGRTIWIKIVGGLVYSQFGTHRQKRRSILPRKGLPFKLGNAIRKGIVQAAPEFLTRAGGHRGSKGTKWGL